MNSTSLVNTWKGSELWPIMLENMHTIFGLAGPINYFLSGLQLVQLATRAIWTRFRVCPLDMLPLRTVF